MTRTDTHSPRVMNPADYTEVGYMDLHPEEGGCWIDHDALAGSSEFVGNFVNRGRCDHCGAGPLRYVAVFAHRPTSELVFVGLQCAAKLALTSRSELTMKKEIQRRQIAQAVERWRAENPEAAEYLEAQQGGRDSFLNDLGAKLLKYGSLSERQTAAILRSKEREAEWQRQRAERKAQEEAELATAGPLTEGRRQVGGVVVSVKWKDSDYGGAWKMLVKEYDGNKVWGTVPQALLDAATDGQRYRIDRPSMPGPDAFVIYEDDRGWVCQDRDTPAASVLLKGREVTFTATVERSRDDQHFGFFKRPAKSELVGPNLLTGEEN